MYIFIAFLPALFMWEFVSVKVNFRLSKPVRKRLFRTGTRFGILAGIIELLESLAPLSSLPPLTHAFVEAFIVAALTEECVKFAGVYRTGRKELDEVGPGIAILLAVGVSLGFAVMENRLYVMHGGLGVWILRALTAVPMHAVFGLVMGSFLSLAWQDHRRTHYGLLALGLIVPMIFHGSYDFLVFAEKYDPSLIWPTQILPPVMLVQGIFAMLITNYALNNDTAIYGRRVPSDPQGHRAATLAGIMLLAVIAFIWLDLSHPQAGLPMLAVMPLVLALDLILTAAVRLSPAR